MYTNSEINRIAMEQSARDIGCSPGAFQIDTNVIVTGSLGTHAKKYYSETIGCNLISYGNNIVAMAKPQNESIVSEYINKFTFYHCFETPNIYWLNDKLVQLREKVCFMAEYFLPDMNRIKRLPCEYELRVLTPENFSNLYLPEWSNALCAERKELDVLGVGAYEDNKLVGLAGCSADCDTMWQIGVDVLPQYRRKGIAAALTSHLAMETIEREKVPFYCCAWSNVRSAKNAFKSGFAPAWIELTVKPWEVADDMNK